MRQALDQGGDFFFQEAGHQPFAARRGNLVERGERDDQGDAVVFRAGVEAVGERVAGAVEVDLGRKFLLLGIVIVGQQRRAFQVEQARLGLLRVAPPAVEGRAVVDAWWHTCVEEFVQAMLIHHQAGIAGALGEVVDFFEQAAVVFEPGRAGLKFARDQGASDEQLARQHRVDRAVMHAAAIHHRQAVQGGAHGRRHLRRFLGPVRVGVGNFQQMPGGEFDPLRLNLRHHAGIDPLGFHDLGGEQPLRLFFHPGAGKYPELHVARAEIGAVLGEHSEVAEEAGQEGLVQGGVR